MLNINNLTKCVISLPERSDRLIAFEYNLRKIFDNVDYIKFDGVKHKLSFKGIGQAHLNCIKYAKDNQLENILIMEDDLLIPSLNTKEYVEKAFNNIPDNYECLLGGIYTSAGRSKYNEYWEQTLEFSGLHFYIVNEKAYDKILQYDFTMHIDKWIGKKLNCYFASPMFAIQQTGFSDNVNQLIDYTYLLKKFTILK